MERHIAAFAYVAASETGHVRMRNEDAIWVADRFVRDGRSSGTIEADARPRLFAVADGVGGAAAGDVASEFVLRELDRRMRHEQTLTADRVRLICHETDELLRAEASTDRSRTGMSTTCTGVAWLGRSLFWFNAGDSRLYAATSGGLEQLSTDHTLREEMHDARIPGNIITNCFGMEKFHVDVGPIPYATTFLLCSDGLSDYADMDAVERVLRAGTGSETLQSQAEELVALALDGGGGDNVSVLLLRPTVESGE